LQRRRVLRGEAVYGGALVDLSSKLHSPPTSTRPARIVVALSMEGKKWILEAHGSADDLRIVEFDVKDPGPEEVLLRVLMTTATYTDQLIMRGNYRPSPPLPLTPGYDCIGEVLKIGSSVKNLSIGDRVAAMPQAHCMTTHLLQPANKVIKVDNSEDPKLQVACIRTGVTAYQMLHRCCAARLGANAASTTMLIHGATGASGSFLLQCALAAGVKATNIFATCAGKNLNVLGAYGVHAIPYDQEPSFDEIVMRETNGRGVDAIFDAVVLGGYYEKVSLSLSLSLPLSLLFLSLSHPNSTQLYTPNCD